MVIAHTGPVYLVAAGAHLPGGPIGNDEIDRFIGTINRSSARIRNRILAENGIRTRHYGIDEQGRSRTSTAAMAAAAVHDCMRGTAVELGEIGLLTTGSSGPDVALPGFANMLQGELGLHPVETSSHQGVCAAGVTAFKHAAMALALRQHEHALVVAAEFPSRMFKSSRFLADGYSADFDSHFLRWMLSDGAGAFLLSRRPRSEGLSLALRGVHLKSFSGDLPVCMQVGYPAKNEPVSYLDYPSLAEAERSGAFFLRQDIRLLPQLFEVAIHEYARLAGQGWVDPARVDHLLCHYSSEKFAPVVADLLERSGMNIPRTRWYTNLAERGNTGAASIFIMLADFLRSREIRPGQQILCFVPESGRFTVAFLLFEVVAGDGVMQETPAARGAEWDLEPARIAPPAELHADTPAPAAAVLRALAQVWHDYRSAAWRTPLVHRIVRRQLTRSDYLRWMGCWIPQVREGSHWMRAAVANIGPPFEELAGLIEAHAGEEQFDFRILFDDYRQAGGEAASIEALRRNPGGEALNAYMFARAGERNPVDLLGAIYIIEGTGQRIIPALLPMLKTQLDLPHTAFRFLEYHGQNDVRHLERWLRGVSLVLERDAHAAERIVHTARTTAQLYLAQLQEVL